MQVFSLISLRLAVKKNVPLVIARRPQADEAISLLVEIASRPLGARNDRLSSYNCASNASASSYATLYT